MAEIQTSTWSETAASNNTAAPDGMPEGMAASGVNDWGRESMAALKREWNRTHPTISSAGTSTAITLTYTTAPAAYVAGLKFQFKVGTTNGATPTLNVNGLGAKNIYKIVAGTATQIAASDWTANQIVEVTYDTTLNASAGGFIWSAANPGDVAIASTTRTSYKNLAGRNGGLEVWQRGAGGAASISVAASTTAYTADGWVLVTAANQASVVDQIAGIATGSRWAARVRRNSGQTGTGTMTFEFPLDTDEIVPMQGAIVTLSMTLKAGANFSPTSSNILVELRTGTGTAAKRSAGAYTGDAAPISTTQAITSSAVRYTFTSTALGASVTQASIYLTWAPTGTAGAADDFTIDDVQLEIGNGATVFERRPFESELLACQRHYEKTYDYSTAPAASTALGSIAITTPFAAGNDWIDVRFKLQKRILPTMTVYSSTGASGNVRNISGAADIAATLANIGMNGCSVNFTCAAAINVKCHIVADAGI